MTLRYDTEHRLANPNEKPTETQKHTHTQNINILFFHVKSRVAP